MKRSAIASAISRIGDIQANNRLFSQHQGGVDKAMIDAYRDAQIPGSISHLESPSPQEADIAVVLIVSGGDRLLRVALGRNRTANLIAELLKVLV